MLEEVLRRQHGVLTRGQALACGVTRSRIAAQVRAGRWRRLTGRVYATFTGPLTRRAQLWAVLLRAGPGAVLSHETAAELAGLVEETSPTVHVTIPANRRVLRQPGVTIHLSRRLAEARHSAALAEVADGCHSVLELRYRRDVEHAHGLPAGERQSLRVRRGGYWYDDVHYRRYRTRVELDGRAAHPKQARFRDMRRDNAAVVGGDAVLRYGWPDVTGDPCECALQVAHVLWRNGWTGTLRPCGPSCVIAKSVARSGVPDSSQWPSAV